MLAFITQALDWLIYRRPHTFPIFFAWIWAIWLSKVLPARWYKPYAKEYKTTSSIIIPVVDEPEHIFRKVLDIITKQVSDTSQVIVVANGKRSEVIEKLCAEYKTTYTFTEVAGKRTAIELGLTYVTGDVTFLVDSDTLWMEDTLVELLKPFANPKVGGATTHQNILDPNRNVLTRFAAWMEDSRTSGSMPSQSVFGKVGCLPGRTIAFRTSILREIVPLFLKDTFLDTHLEISDDRTLTNYTLMKGYDTVYQRTAVVYTDAPQELGPFIRQQYRWARGSQYNTLRMWPWMVRHAPLTALHFTSDTVTPFIVVVMLVHMIKSFLFPSKRQPMLNRSYLSSWKIQVPMAIIGACLSLATRNMKYLKSKPGDIKYLPVFAFLLTVIMTPIRIWGFMTCAWRAGWGTRQNAYKGSKNKMRPKQHIPFVVGLVKFLVALWAGTKVP